MVQRLLPLVLQCIMQHKTTKILKETGKNKNLFKFRASNVRFLTDEISFYEHDEGKRWQNIIVIIYNIIITTIKPTRVWAAKLGQVDPIPANDSRRRRGGALFARTNTIRTRDLVFSVPSSSLRQTKRRTDLVAN